MTPREFTQLEKVIAQRLERMHTLPDFHRHTAANVVGGPVMAVTAEQRRTAKNFNFGIMYGFVGQDLGVGRWY